MIMNDLQKKAADWQKRILQTKSYNRDIDFGYLSDDPYFFVD